MKSRFVLPLGLLVAAGHSAMALAQWPGTFSVTDRMTTPRSEHTATLLPNGKVSVAGGRDYSASSINKLAAAELYDPVTGTFAPTGDMTTPRSLHTATLLADGRVLIAGGVGGFGPGYNSADIYDPSTGTFAATGNMIGNHMCHQVNLLGNGKVLIAGRSLWCTL